MRAAVASSGSLEQALPRRVKQMLVVVMTLLILFLLLSFETSNSVPFLYVGF
jgi:hypothetical protein